MLLPGFLAIARELGLPLDICEIGSSAGLNLLFDRFAYDFGGNGWGDRASPVRLAPEIRGGAPRLDGNIAIASRTGNDIRPIDIADPAERLRLRSYVWADQALRLARLDAAIGLAEQNPYNLERADAARFVEQKFASRKAGTAQVLFHSIMWQYLADATRQAITGDFVQGGGGRNARHADRVAAHGAARHTPAARDAEPDAVAGRRNPPSGQMRLSRTLDRMDGLKPASAIGSAAGVTAQAFDCE